MHSSDEILTRVFMHIIGQSTVPSRSASIKRGNIPVLDLIVHDSLVNDVYDVR